jgi:hypothetical protein
MLFFAFLFLVTQIRPTLAQQATATAGGEGAGEGGSVSYTVGQNFYNTSADTAGSVHEGVQQPYEIVVITDIHSLFSSKVKLKVFPNPATDHLVLNVPEITQGDLFYQIQNLKGEIVISGKIHQLETRINLDSQPKGIYLLYVNLKQSSQKIFKIVKN